MSGSGPKLACRERLRSCDSAKKKIQSDDEEEGNKMQNGDGKAKNMKTSAVCLDKEKKKERMNNNNNKEKKKERQNTNNNSNEKMTRADDHEGETKMWKRDDAGKNGKVSCSKKKMQTEDDVKEEEVEIWNDHNKASTASYDRHKKRKRLNNTSSEKMKHRNDDHWEEEHMWNYDCDEVKSEEEAATFSEKEKKKKRPNNTDSEKKKIRSGDNKKEKQMQNFDCKMKNGEFSATFFDKENKKDRRNNCNGEKEMQNGHYKEKEKEKKKKRLNNTDSEKVVQIDDEKYVKKTQNGHYKVKIGKVSTASLEKEKEKKLPSSDHVEKNTPPSLSKNKMRSNDGKKTTDDNVENNTPSSLSKNKMRSNNGKKKTADNVENNTPPLLSKNKTQSNDGKKKTDDNVDNNTPPSLSKNKMQSNDNKKKEPITSVVKERKIRPCESTEMEMRHSGKQKKRNVPSYMSKEKKMNVPIDSNYEKRKREEPHTLFKQKRMRSDVNDKNIRSGKMKEKRNCGDEQKRRKRNIPFSFFKVICNNFKEFLSIPPTVAPELEDWTNHHIYLEDSEGKFSKVRLSMVDGSLAFHQGWNVFVSDHLIKWGEFLLFDYTAASTFSVRIFGRDSRERLHFDVGRKRQVVRKKQMQTNRSSDDLVSLDVKSEDIVDDYYSRNKEPETYRVTVRTKEDPKRVERGVGSGPMALDNKNKNGVIQQCETEGMSPLRSKEKRVILITDSGSSIHENDIVKLTTSTADSDAHHVAVDTNEDPKRVLNGIGNGPPAVVDKEKGSLPDVECGTNHTSPKCSEKKARSLDVTPLTHENDDTSKYDFELHDPDEDLRKKQGISSIHFECATTVSRYHNNSEMNFSQNVSTKYEAPGGFRCLEKWKKSIVSGQAVLDGTGLIKLETPQKTDNKLVVEYGAVVLNPVDTCVWSKGTHTQPIFTMPVKDPSRPDTVSMCEHEAAEINDSIDGKGAVVQLQMRREQLEPLGSILTRPKDNYLVCLGLNPVRSEGTCAFIESQLTLPIKKPSSPDRISKCGNSRIEANHNVYGKDTTAKLETKMGHFEPVRSIVGSQSTDTPVCVNNVAALQSEHCFFKQEDRKSIDCLTPVATLPVCDRISECGSNRTEANYIVDGKGATAKLETKMHHSEPVGCNVGSQSTNIPVCANNVAAHQSEHCYFKQEDRKSIDCLTPVATLPVYASNVAAHQSEHCFFKQEDRKFVDCVTPVATLPVKTEILESDDRSLLKINLQFCIPNTPGKWLELPKSLSNAVRQIKQDRNVIMLKDPMKRLWPVFYHENSIFVGFTAGWKHFVAANNLQIGDLCELFKEPGDEEPVYSVQITKK